MSQHTLFQRLGAETLGTAFLLSAIVGSGIMGDRLSGQVDGLALLCNSTATGMILAVLVTCLGPISGAHFNPAVTAVFAARGDIGARDALLYVAAQVTGAIAGVIATHLMFDVSFLQTSATTRTGVGQWSSEVVATFGLVATILLTLRARPDAVAAMVGLYVASAIWFTSSTCFANPAVTIGRIVTDTFTGIRPLDAPAFIIAQVIGGFVALYGVAALTFDVSKTTSQTTVRKLSGEAESV